MFTLLPAEQKNKLKKEYRYRFATVIACMFGALVLTACVLLFPAYIISNIKTKEAVIKKQSLESSSLYAEKTALRKKLTEVQQQLQLVGMETASSTSVIDEVLKIKPPEIKITHLVYEHAPDSSTFVVLGRAATRQALLDYKKSLEGISLFEGVNFPVSDLSKGTNIDFTVTIIGKF